MNSNLSVFMRRVIFSRGLFPLAMSMILTYAGAAHSGPVDGRMGRKPIVAVMHCDYSPVSFWDEAANTPSGFFVDVMDQVAARTGLEVKYTCKNGWDKMIAAIEQGEADLGVLLKSAEREKKLLFSAPIDATYNLSFFSLTHSDMDPDSVPFGRTVGVITGGMAHEQLKGRPGIRLHEEGSYQEGLFGLLAGEIDLFAAEEFVVLKHMREIGLEDRITKVGKPFVTRLRCLALRRDNVQLLGLLNKGLEGYIDGPEYQKAYLKWYGAPTPYWTNRKIVTAGAVFLFLVVTGMALWRYASVSRFNKELMRSVAERRKAEERLIESEERFRLAMLGATDGLWDWDLATDEVYYSPRWKSMLGYAEDELEGRLDTWKRVIHPDDLGPSLAFIHDFLAGRAEKYELEFRLQHKEGRYLDILSRASLVRGSEGEPLRLVGTHVDITGRKQAKAALRETNAKLQALIQALPDAVFFKDRDGRYLTVNKAFEQYSGATQDMVIGKTDGDFMPADIAEGCSKSDEEIINGGGQLLLEDVLTGEDGGKTYLESVKVPVQDPAGNVIGLVGVSRNVTARKRAETEFSRLSRQRELILNSAGEGIYGLDPDGNITFVNPAAAQMVGWSIEELINRPSHEVFHHSRPDGSPYPREECAFHKALMAGAVHQVKDEVFWRRDGTSFPIEYVSTPMRENGAIVGAVVVFKDITDRMQAERTLRSAVNSAREEKARTEAFISAIGDGISIHDTGFRIIFQNQVCREVFGSHVGEICHRAYQGREGICEDCQLADTFKDGGIRKVEKMAMTPAGKTWLSITSSPLKDAEGNIIGGIELFRDITRQKNAEEVLRRSHAELEILVEERTAELTMMNEQLRNFSTYTQNARENERTVIAREIHDDLGQSLTALKMDLAQLRKRLPKDQKRAVAKAESMSELVDATIQSVKRISMDLRPGILDHLGLAAALEWQAQEFEKRTGIRCSIAFEPEDIVLDKDRTTALFRIFQETLTNVARHANATKISALLQSRAAELFLQVTDNGRGITESEKSDPKSLGLIGIRERVNNWGGSLSITGIPKQGTTVMVRLPHNGAGGMPC